MTGPRRATRPAPRPPADDRALLLLGLLISQDRHGYEINDFIEQQLHFVTDLKKATAYQLLGTLERHGLVESRLEQHGARPSRRVYHLIPAGHAHFQTLLAEHLRAQDALILQGNIPVMFSEHLAPAERLSALEARLSAVEGHLHFYDAMTFPFPDGVRLALARLRALTVADRDWLRDTVRHLRAAQDADAGS